MVTFCIFMKRHLFHFLHHPSVGAAAAAGDLMPIRALPSIVTFAKGLLLKSSRSVTASRFVHHTQPVVASIDPPKWGSKNKKDKRKVPLHRTIEMSLSPESEAILAPLRAKVKEQVRVFSMTLLGFQFVLTRGMRP